MQLLSLEGSPFTETPFSWVSEGRSFTLLWISYFASNNSSQVLLMVVVDTVDTLPRPPRIPLWVWTPILQLLRALFLMATPATCF